MKAMEVKGGAVTAGGSAWVGRRPRAPKIPSRARLGLLGAFLCLLSMTPGCVTQGMEEEKARREKAIVTRDLGLDHLYRGRVAMAIRKLREAMGENSEDPITSHGLGEAYRRKGLLDEAEFYFLESLALAENQSDFDAQSTILSLAVLYIQQERYEEARAQAQILIDDPTYSSPWLALTNRGWAEYRMSRLELARQSFEEALEFNPTYGTARLNLGRIDQEERRWLRSIEQFELALDSRGMTLSALAELNYRLAESFMALERKDEAIVHLRAALERDPYGKWGKDSRSYLNLLK